MLSTISEKFLWEIVQTSLMYNLFRFNGKSNCFLSFFSSQPGENGIPPMFLISIALCFCAPEPTLVFLRNSAMFLDIWLLKHPDACWLSLHGRS